MQPRLKRFLCCCALLLCCSLANAFRTGPDSVDYRVPPDQENAASEYAEEEEPDDSEPGGEAAAPADFSPERQQRRTIIYNRQSPAESRWLELSSDDDYSYRTKREFVARPEVRRKEPPRWFDFIVRFFHFFSTNSGHIVLWSLLVLIAGYITYRIITGDGGLFGRRDLRQVNAALPDVLSEDGLVESDWEARLRSALAAGAQRDAVRFGYLHILKQLQLRGLIHFRPDKTNIAYYRELGETLRPGFRDLTRVYEYAWYGNFLPDASGMQDYLQHLDQFLQRIPRP